MLLILNDVELQSRLDAHYQTISNIVGTAHSIERQVTIGGNGISFSLKPNTTCTDLERVTSERDIDEWAAMLSMGESFSLGLAFNEDWRSIPTNKADWRQIVLTDELNSGRIKNIKRNNKTCRWWIFDGLRLRFYVKSESKNTLGNGLYQWLRCEWEPYTFQPGVTDPNNPLKPKKLDEIAAALIFPAGVAAHPHFHFDSVPLSRSARSKSTNAQAGPVEFIEQTDSSLEFGGTSEQDWMMQSSSSELKHLHLPTITSWQRAVGSNNMREGELPTASMPLPHQHYPKSTDELDQWFSWCATYFTHQFDEYIKDG